MTASRVTPRRLQEFTGAGYDKGRPKLWQAAWFATQNLIFAKWWCPAAWRPKILRLFGAEIGERVFIRHRVRVLWPWKLSIGDDSWIGEGVWLLNLEPISIGQNVCLSQEAFLCTGNHDANDVAFEYLNKPIAVADGAWVGARALVTAGTSIVAGHFIPSMTVASPRSEKHQEG